MPENSKTNINNTPKLLKLLCIFAPLLGFFVISNTLDSDFYFIYKTGEYVVNNGFPTVDFLSMHSSMHIIAQQWLSAVLFYFVYSKLGESGMIALVYICYALLCVVMYRLTTRISNNFPVSCAFSFVADILIAMMYEYTRPQSITLLLIVLELYLLESFVRKNKIIYLAFLPLISVALINLHAAMWGMLFVFALPYAAAALPVKLGKFRQEPCCSFIKLLVCGAVCFAVGFINPYGLEAMTYIMSSFGSSDINSLIIEMQKPSLATSWGIVLFGVLFVLTCITAAYKKRAFSTRFVLLFAGTLFMALLNAKSIAYFIVGGLPAFSYMLKDARIKLNPPEKKEQAEKGDGKRAVLLIGLLVVALGALVAVIVAPPSDKTTDNADVAPAITERKALNDIVAILDKENPENVVLFADFKQGQYFEFYGYHPYIDARAELYLKKNNKEFDYLNEYLRLKNGGLYYKDFVDKYGFTYLAVSSSNHTLGTALEHDDDYELLYESEYADLYRLKA